MPPKKAKKWSLLVILGTQMASQLAFFWHWQGVTLAYFWHWLGVTLAIFWHPLRVTLAYHANVTRSECQKYANVTPCQCQKNANRDAIWVLSITRRDQFLAFLGGKEGKKLILTYVAVFRGARSLIYEKFLLCDRVPLIPLQGSWILVMFKNLDELFFFLWSLPARPLPFRAI